MRTHNAATRMYKKVQILEKVIFFLFLFSFSNEISCSSVSLKKSKKKNSFLKNCQYFAYTCMIGHLAISVKFFTCYLSLMNDDFIYVFLKDVTVTFTSCSFLQMNYENKISDCKIDGTYYLVVETTLIIELLICNFHIYRHCHFRGVYDIYH